MVVVTLDTYASDGEIAAISQAFATIGIHEVRINRDYERKAGADGQLPWMIIVAVPLTAFITELAKKAADDSYPLLKSSVQRGLTYLVVAMREARNRQYETEVPGRILLRDTLGGATFIMDPGLPDAAYLSLSQQDLASFGSSYVHYDSELEKWVSW